MVRNPTSRTFDFKSTKILNMEAIFYKDNMAEDSKHKRPITEAVSSKFTNWKTLGIPRKENTLKVL
jgi:hypothetical protein